ncbi:hypothetical protein [Streptomyces flavofungini]|uniref:hypothetical protein n=1 Tax=Streptomyces flavofungini TaxID=68200 RepID=UPI0025AFC1C3|nr:hypothetical protein [Streptomyces flavofungini]WJV47415.1 hypothetical protein QUY26_18930 [Streptomyces flavofungini]
MYWHVKNKDDLVQLVGDEVWNEIGLVDPDAVGWRAAVTSMVFGLRDMCTRHPWLVQAFGSYLLYGPAKARYDDHCLAVGAGFTPAEADQVAAGVFTFVRLDSPAADFGAAPEDSFTHGLSTLLDGYEDQLATRQAGAAVRRGCPSRCRTEFSRPSGRCRRPPWAQSA